MLKAIQAVVSDINAIDGVLGRKLSMMVEDGETNPEAAVRRSSQVGRCRRVVGGYPLRRAISALSGARSGGSGA
jgi:ABC-type branched-subunit amino acid transport system substrate-binding protein